MGKVDRLCIWVEPFAALFWALGNVLANTWPCPPDRHHSMHRCMYTKHFLIWSYSWFNSQQSRAVPLPFLIYLGMLFTVCIYAALECSLLYPWVCFIITQGTLPYLIGSLFSFPTQKLWTHNFERAEWFCR